MRTIHVRVLQELTSHCDMYGTRCDSVMKCNSCQVYHNGLYYILLCHTFGTLWKGERHVESSFTVFHAFVFTPHLRAGLCRYRTFGTFFYYK